MGSEGASGGGRLMRGSVLGRAGGMGRSGKVLLCGSRGGVYDCAGGARDEDV